MCECVCVGGYGDEKLSVYGGIDITMPFKITWLEGIVERERERERERDLNTYK